MWEEFKPKSKCIAHVSGTICRDLTALHLFCRLPSFHQYTYNTGINNFEYRHISFYCTLLSLTSHIQQFSQIEGKILHQKKRLTCFVDLIYCGGLKPNDNIFELRLYEGILYLEHVGSIPRINAVSSKSMAVVNCHLVVISSITLT